MFLIVIIVGTAADLYIQIEKLPTKYIYQIILICLYGIVITGALFLGCIRFISSYLTMSKIPSLDLQITGKYANETNIQTRHFLQLTKVPEINQIDLIQLMKLYNSIEWNQVDPIQKKAFKQQTQCLFKQYPTEVELERAQEVLEFIAQKEQ